MLLCFTLAWVMQLLIWLVVLSAVVAIIQVLLRFVVAPFGPAVVQILNIIMWAVIAIYCLYIVFELLSCLIGGGLPRLH